MIHNISHTHNQTQHKIIITDHPLQQHHHRHLHAVDVIAYAYICVYVWHGAACGNATTQVSSDLLTMLMIMMIDD